MDFKDSLKQFSERVLALKENILTEEATKNAFIMPFIQLLGYDVFNPLEVIPEMDCDLIKKKGDKLDYAIMREGEPILLIECKHWQQNLDLHATQLQKYFVASKAKFGLLTNGITYRFYADLEKENIMDDVPFLEINLEALREAQIEELKKFHKSYFDVDNILSSANELKYMSSIKKEIRNEYGAPSSELVKMLTKRVYEGVVTQKILEQFIPLTKRAMTSLVNDILSERLNIALQGTNEGTAPSTPDTEDTGNEQNIAIVEEDKPKVETTEEELEGFYIVKSICREVLDSERITYRDAQSYFAIFADDNNRRPICRLYFNSANKRLSVIINKEETKYDIQKLDDIYNYAKELKEAASQYTIS